jgi:ferredoxin
MEIINRLFAVICARRITASYTFSSEIYLFLYSFNCLRKNNITLDIFFASYFKYISLSEKLQLGHFATFPIYPDRWTNCRQMCGLSTNCPENYKYMILRINSNLCHHCCNVVYLAQMLQVLAHGFRSVSG